MSELKMDPYISIFVDPINKHDDPDNSDNLYHVLVSQGKIKMLFLVISMDMSNNPKRQYETIRGEYLTLHGIDERDQYLEKTDEIAVSADVSIVNSVFEHSLKPFGIRLNKCSFHNFDFFESQMEGKGFFFEDSDKYEILKDLIKKKCIYQFKHMR